MGFMKVLKSAGGVAKAAGGLGLAVGDLGLTVVGEVGKAAFKGVKVVANVAADVMCTSGPNSELTYRYDGFVGDGHYECRKVLGQALVDLALKRSRDSYLRDILSQCSRVDLSGSQGQVLYALARNRSVCEQVLRGDEEAVQSIKKCVENVNPTDDAIVNAAKRVEGVFREGRDYSGFVSKVFVVSVGEDIKDFVYDSNGEHVRDANGGRLEEVVGTNDGVAVFKVTFANGQQIKFKVHQNGSWRGLMRDVHKYI